MRNPLAREGEDGARDEGEDTPGRSDTATNSGTTRSIARAKSASKKKKRKATYKQEVRPVIERILGQMELILLTGMDEVEDEA